MMRDIEEVLSNIHIAFTDCLMYFPRISNRPETEYPDYLVSCYAYPSKPMIWIATDFRDYSQQGKALSAGITEHTGKTYPDQDYVCNLYVRRADRCGNKEGDLYWYKDIE